MIQAANGGYLGVAGTIVLADLNYQEAGYTTMQPVVLNYEANDTIFVALRKRVGNAYSNGFNISKVDISLVDETTGEDVPFTASDVTSSQVWYRGWHSTVILNISTLNEDTRYRRLSLLATDTSNNQFTVARININESNQSFHYLILDRAEITERPLESSVANSSLIIDPSSYNIDVLLSLSGSFSETTNRAVSDFSYQPQQIHYIHNKEINTEEYSFSIKDRSHKELNGLTRIFSVPQYRQVGVLSIDGYLKSALQLEGGQVGSFGTFEAGDKLPNLTIQAIGRLSKTSHELTIYFTV